jgi:uncharacterized protein (TIGR02145 family)
MKVVINRCFGGFSVSREIYEMMGLKWDDYGYAFDNDRTNKELIKCIEKIGTERSSEEYRSAKLEVVNIPDDATDWEILNYNMGGWGHIVGPRLMTASPDFASMGTDDCGFNSLPATCPRTNLEDYTKYPRATCAEYWTTSYREVETPYNCFMGITSFGLTQILTPTPIRCVKD